MPLLPPCSTIFRLGLGFSRHCVSRSRFRFRKGATIADVAQHIFARVPQTEALEFGKKRISATKLQDEMTGVQAA
jgi:hypothetical protein